MMKSYFIVSLFLTLLLFPLSRSTKAQWTNYNLNSINLDVQGTALRNQVRSQIQSEQRQDAVNSGKPKTPKKISEQNIATKLVYKPSVTNRQVNLKRFVEKTRENNPAGAIQMEQLFASKDVIGQINQGMTTIGLKSNNVADAYALYWVSAWLGTRGRSENLPKSQMIAVRNQAAGALLKVPELTSATDAQKQEMAEAMLIQSLLISASIDSAKSDPVLTEKVKVVIAQGAKGMGLDLDQMTLTTTGFRSAAK
jgi:hypothetical protein